MNDILLPGFEGETELSPIACRALLRVAPAVELTGPGGPVGRVRLDTRDGGPDVRVWVPCEAALRPGDGVLMIARGTEPRSGSAWRVNLTGRVVNVSVPLGSSGTHHPGHQIVRIVLEEPRGYRRDPGARVPRPRPATP